ncbi:MAG: NADH-quinone oxidoreductase subunit NuoN, partial [Burkholderiaceae bacterium]
MVEKLKLLVAMPELLLLIAASVLIMVDAIWGKDRNLPIDKLALLCILFPALATLYQMGQPDQFAFNGMYVADSLAHLLKLCSYIAIATTIVYSRFYGGPRGLHRGEFYALALFALLGQMIMISASNLLVVYMGLELMSLSLYALAALRRDSATSTEAAIKYFILGALASGFLLYGMSMMYGATGDLSIPAIASAFSNSGENRIVLVLGAVFIVAGLAFKFGAVPFHMWVPDVYQGTPSSVTLLIAGAPKIAAFAIAFRLLAEALLPAAEQWQPMLMLLAVGSLVIGNLVAISQTNFKRMLAYSTIAQIGFVFLGMLSGVTADGGAQGTSSAWGASMFYMVTYVMTTLGTLGVILLLSRDGFEGEQITDLAGLSKRSPWIALVMLILMFSLAGVPPTVGFVAKLSVLKATVAAGHVWLAVLAVLTSLVAAFYYLRVVKTMYFDPVPEVNATNPGGGLDARVLLGINGGLALLLGLMPQPLMSACVQAVSRA